MEKAPVDFHDIAMYHDFIFDKEYRLRLIEEGIFNFPLPTKQGSISFAHSVYDVQETLEKTRRVVKDLIEIKSRILS
jgi:glutamate-1-semialdehyde 2,1-aminomutase